MDYKINNLKEKIYKEFIRGVYGNPKIPSEKEVMEKLEEITELDYIPITPKERMSELNISDITSKFSNIIDDIDVLFDSVEAESRDVLDQLTHSLKENNGTRRELRRVRERANDIITGKLGEEYLEYNFTESFDDVGNIDVLRSNPVNTDAGVFTIGDDSNKLLTLYHYMKRKIEFNVVEFYGRVTDYGYIGDTDAGAILDKEDPRSLTYRVQTNKPGRMRTVFSLQLRADGRAEKINSVGMSLDSTMTGGKVRLYYQKEYKWKDVPTINVQDIKGDSVVFTFTEVEATHIKFEFIKDGPDVPDTNEYYFIIHEVAIAKSTTRNTATLYSKPIIIQSYSNEPVIIGNLSCVIDGDIPDECEAKVYVAQDVLISGSFQDDNGNSVYPDSINAVNFSPTATGTVFLSDMWAKAETVSGITQYQGVDFDWKDIKPSKSFGDVVPEKIEFNNTTQKKKLDNTIFSIADWYLFGDDDYTGPWPQYTGYGDWFMSGWCNVDNPWWDPYLKDLVESGVLVSGVDVGELVFGSGYDFDRVEPDYGSIDPAITGHALYSGQWLGLGNGYPWNYYREDVDRTLRFGDYGRAFNGWWRPYSEAVTPTGINSAFTESGVFDTQYITTNPDFYFNGIKFYQIYKFSKAETILDPSIKLYTFQERPVGKNNDYYPHNFIWKYKSDWITDTDTRLNETDESNSLSDSFENYKLTLPTLSDNEEYIGDGVIELRKHNSNVVFSDQDYEIIRNSNGKVTGISLAPLADNYPHLSPSGNSFDYVYNYRIQNRYLSTWTAFAIVSPGIRGEITFDNPNINGRDEKILKSVVAENLDDEGLIESEGIDDKLNIVLDASNSTTNKHFKLTIYCASDEATGFSAKSGTSDTSHWIPSVERGVMSVNPGIKIVPRLERLRVVNIASLLYDTPMNNDRRCALITNAVGEKILVVKTPSKDIFPGHYFENETRQYKYNSRIVIQNKGHWIRRASTDNGSNDIIYTTGSASGKVYDIWGEQDITWNEGYQLGEFANTIPSGIYPNHSTYGYPINVNATPEVQWVDTLYSGDLDLRSPLLVSGKVGTTEWEDWIKSDPELSGSSYLAYLNNKFKTGIGYYSVNTTIPNRGFLYYPTAENLPTFYSISFRSAKETSEINKRFVYKIQLSSDGKNKLAPKIRSVRFKVNKVD